MNPILFFIFFASYQRAALELLGVAALSEPSAEEGR